MGGGGSTGLGIIPKKQFYYCFPYFDDKRNTYFSEQKMEVKQDANKDDISSCLMTKYLPKTAQSFSIHIELMDICGSI